ncbi:hypothetical protein pb186bvf_003801 [Paramecium bursaria]
MERPQVPYWKKNFYLIGFLILLGITFIAGLLGVLNGDPKKITKGYDSSTMACGSDVGLENYPYAYFVNPDKSYLNKIVCVSECPKQLPNGTTTQLKCSPNQVIKSCQEKVSIFKPEETQLIYDSFVFKNNICMPTTLDYYSQLAPVSTPSTLFKFVNDINNTKWTTLILPPVFSLLLCFFVMKILRQETEKLVWGMTIFIFILVASAGIIFAKRTYQAYHLDENSISIGDFKVSEQYIDKKTDTPSLFFNLLLTLTFTSCTLYGGYYLFTNYERISGLCKLFEITEKFMDNYMQIQRTAIYFSGFFLIIFGILYIFIIELLSCFKVVPNQTSGPFDQVQSSIISFFVVFVIITGLWALNYYSVLLDYITLMSFQRWMTSQLNQGNNQVDDDSILNRLRSLLRLQSSLGYWFSEVSCLLMLSPIIFVADSIRDGIQNIKNPKYQQHKEFIRRFVCCCAYWIYDKGQDLEPFIFIEEAYHHGEISELRQRVRGILREDNNFRESYEQLRNVGQFFILSIKLFFTLIVASLMFLIFSSLQFYQAEIYSPVPAAIISAFIGYNICSLYFVIYQSGVYGLAYIYCKEYQKINQNLTPAQQQLYKVLQQFKEATSEILADLIQAQQEQQQGNP